MLARSGATMAKTARPQRIDRTDTLKQGLLARKRELEDDVQRRIRGGRAQRAQEGTDDLEHSEADIQDDLALALLQIQSQTLARIDAALARLDAGGYGRCVECEHEIAARRLHALPFAVRCQGCEESREQAHRQARRLSPNGGTPVRFSDLGLFQEAR
jgi:DnaK suppressor protein